jgi:cell division protein FtsB
VERVAREELGKAKAGETIYRFTERKTNAFRVRR